MTRTFESGPARRFATLIAAAAVGPSGSGKTVSWLRFAAGMRRVKPAKTFLVDSNLKRSLHHAPTPSEKLIVGSYQDFEVVHISAPFDPDSWRGAFKHCVDRGAGRIIADCMSDEWESEGGVLDSFEKKLDELVERRLKKDPRAEEWKVREQLTDQAWKIVKAPHKQLRLWMWQQPVDWLLTYRAKEKTERRKSSATVAVDPNAPPPGKAPKTDRVDMGWQPIGAADVVYDLLFKCLLPPMGDGRPVWNPGAAAEKLLVKHPGWFREMFAAHPQIDEDLGEKIALWAAGAEMPSSTATSSATSSPRTSSPAAGAASPPTGARTGGPAGPTLAERLDACTTRQDFDAIDAEVRRTWRSLDDATKKAIDRAGAAAQQRVKQDPPPPIDGAAEIARIEAEHERRQGGDHVR